MEGFKLVRYDPKGQSRVEAAVIYDNIITCRSTGNDSSRNMQLAFKELLKAVELDPGITDAQLKLGEFLLMDALHRSCSQSQVIAAMAVVVDAQDDTARSFYERYGFIRFPELPYRLFLPMKTIASLFG